MSISSLLLHKNLVGNRILNYLVFFLSTLKLYSIISSFLLLRSLIKVYLSFPIRFLISACFYDLPLSRFNLYLFTQFNTHHAFWMWEFITFIHSGKALATMSSNFTSPSFSFIFLEILGWAFAFYILCLLNSHIFKSLSLCWILSSFL